MFLGLQKKLHLDKEMLPVLFDYKPSTQEILTARDSPIEMGRKNN